MSDYYTKAQTEAVADETVNDFYNTIILVDYSTTSQMNSALALKQDKLPIASPDFNFLLFSSSGTLMWVNDSIFVY